VPYFFTERGSQRWDNITATDLGLAFSVPIRRAEVFLQADVLNLFDESAQLRGNTTVHTAFDDARTLLPFDPRTGTPVEGVHYRKGKGFGESESLTDYQQPRTFQFSAGLRF
jgi:hypothetical protein